MTTSLAGADAQAPAPLDTFEAAALQWRWDCFDAPVPAGGYRWWYVDALSRDGAAGITLIAMLGSVFSPYYRSARRRNGGLADPLAHSALNVALYGRPAKRWALTERGPEALQRSPDGFALGPSEVHWDGTHLHFTVRERSAPLGRPLEGEVRVTPLACTDRVVELNPAGPHHWWPIAPRCDVQVRFTRPRVQWSGTGYLDSNFGATPLEAGFRHWDWSRAAMDDGSTVVLYNLERRDGARHALAVRVDRDGGSELRELPREAHAGRGLWGVARPTRADAETAPRLLEVLEDTPFYTRSVLETRLYGEGVRAMHESLDLDRFTAPWVQRLIPFRNPRRARA